MTYQQLAGELFAGFEEHGGTITFTLGQTKVLDARVVLDGDVGEWVQGFVHRVQDEIIFHNVSDRIVGSMTVEGDERVGGGVPHLHLVDGIGAHRFDSLPDTDAVEQSQGAAVQGGHAIIELSVHGKALEFGGAFQEENGLVREDFLLAWKRMKGKLSDMKTL